MKRILVLTLSLVFALGLFAQQMTIKGIVTDNQGETIIGCNVVNVKNSSVGTMTDIDGKYSLAVNVGDVIRFAYIGYKTKEVKIESGKATYNVVLEEDSQMLMESVVMGYASGISVVRKESILSLGNSRYDSLAEEEYTEFGENKFKTVQSEPVSTFSADVDKASYSNMRRFLENGLFPPRDAIRTEELINYFPYNYTQPTGENPITIEAEVGKCPWNTANLLCKIGLKTRDIPTKNLPPSNFVFLIDVSGSMEGPTRLELVKSSMSLLTDNLNERDRVAIVVYSGNAGVVLPSTSGKNKAIIKEALNRLQAGGSTAGGQGIQLAYKIAKENFIQGGNNRVILCTDGDFNVGVSSNKGLEELIEEERKSGVFLSILGYGMGNYKDSKMQTLAQKGNGNHAYIDDIKEANRVLVTEFAGTLYTVAKDVKLQVEFNPDNVAAYRLIGYETRLLNKEDFDDDLKDAGDMGSGHTVTALYELQLTDSGKKDSEKLLAVSMRYKDPQEETSKLISIPVHNTLKNKNSIDFDFVSAVAMFAQLIRNSEFAGNSTYKDVELLAASSLGKDKEGYRKEFLELVRKADKMVRESKQSGKAILYGNVRMEDDFDTFYEEVDGDEKEGIKDKAGKIIIPAIYDDIDYVKGGIFIVELNDKYGLYQYYSGQITPVMYDDIEELGEDMFKVKKDGRYGVLDLYGREIIAPLYDDVEEEYYGYFRVEKGDKYGVFNNEGKQIVPVRYDDIEMRGQAIIVEQDDKHGLYSIEGKLVIPVKYEDIWNEGGYYMLEGPDGRYGLANEKGKLIVPVKYEDIDILTQDVFVVNKPDGKYGAYNSKGRKIAQEVYDDIEIFENTRWIKDEKGLSGYLLLEKNEKQGVISASGKTIVPTSFDDIESGDEADRIVAEKGDKEFIYNLKGKLLSTKKPD